jgi:hypothetical protein
MTGVDGQHANVGDALAPIDLRCTATVRRLRFAPMMSSKQTILDRELFTQALRHMGEEDLLYLNRMVVERLNLLAQAKRTVALAQFVEGDRVQFTASDGSVKYGIVLRLNKKTASVRTDEGQSWKVSPGLLCKIATR